MSRSYKKHNFSSYVCYKSDKPFRTAYNRARRRKDHQILSECEKEFVSSEYLFKPYEKPCSLFGEVCCVDDWYYDDPKKWLVNEPAKDEKDYPKPCGLCCGCGWSENNHIGNIYERIEFNCWDPSADEKFNNKRVAYDVSLADKWSWPSDGGVFYQGGKAYIRKELEEEVFGYDHLGCRWDKFPRNVWEKYQKAIKPDSFLSGYFWIDWLIKKGVMPKTFKNADELVDWYRENEEKLVDIWFKKHVRK